MSSPFDNGQAGVPLSSPVRLGPQLTFKKGLQGKDDPNANSAAALLRSTGPQASPTNAAGSAVNVNSVPAQAPNSGFPPRDRDRRDFDRPRDRDRDRDQRDPRDRPLRRGTSDRNDVRDRDRPRDRPESSEDRMFRTSSTGSAYGRDGRDNRPQRRSGDYERDWNDRDRSTGDRDRDRDDRGRDYPRRDDRWSRDGRDRDRRTSDDRFRRDRDNEARFGSPSSPRGKRDDKPRDSRDSRGDYRRSYQPHQNQAPRPPGMNDWGDFDMNNSNDPDAQFECTIVPSGGPEYTKEELLACFSANLPRPAMPNVPGVCLDKPAVPINLAPLSATEEAAMATGSWYLSSRNYTRNPTNPTPSNSRPRGRWNGEDEPLEEHDEDRDRDRDDRWGTLRDRDRSYSRRDNRDRGSFDERDDTAIRPRDREERPAERVPERPRERDTERSWRQPAHSELPPEQPEEQLLTEAQQQQLDALTFGDDATHLHQHQEQLLEEEDPELDRQTFGDQANAVTNGDAPDQEATGGDLEGEAGQQDGGEDREWFYQDPQGQTQGPFSDEDMRAWFEDGFFSLGLPVTAEPSKGFRPLVQWFSEGNSLFLDYVPDVPQSVRPPPRPAFPMAQVPSQPGMMGMPLTPQQHQQMMAMQQQQRVGMPPSPLRQPMMAPFPGLRSPQTGPMNPNLMQPGGQPLGQALAGLSLNSLSQPPLARAHSDPNRGPLMGTPLGHMPMGPHDDLSNKPLGGGLPPRSNSPPWGASNAAPRASPINQGLPGLGGLFGVFGGQPAQQPPLSTPQNLPGYPSAGLPPAGGIVMRSPLAAFQGQPVPQSPFGAPQQQSLAAQSPFGAFPQGQQQQGQLGRPAQPIGPLKPFAATPTGAQPSPFLPAQMQPQQQQQSSMQSQGSSQNSQPGMPYNPLSLGQLVLHSPASTPLQTHPLPSLHADGQHSHAPQQQQPAHYQQAQPAPTNTPAAGQAPSTAPVVTIAPSPLAAMRPVPIQGPRVSLQQIQEEELRRQQEEQAKRVQHQREEDLKKEKARQAALAAAASAPAEPRSIPSLSEIQREQERLAKLEAQKQAEFAAKKVQEEALREQERQYAEQKKREEEEQGAWAAKKAGAKSLKEIQAEEAQRAGKGAGQAAEQQKQQQQQTAAERKKKDAEAAALKAAKEKEKQEKERAAPGTIAHQPKKAKKKGVVIPLGALIEQVAEEDANAAAAISSSKAESVWGSKPNVPSLRDIIEQEQGHAEHQHQQQTGAPDWVRQAKLAERNSALWDEEPSVSPPDSTRNAAAVVAASKATPAKKPVAAAPSVWAKPKTAAAVDLRTIQQKEAEAAAAAAASAQSLAQTVVQQTRSGGAWGTTPLSSIVSGKPPAPAPAPAAEEEEEEDESMFWEYEQVEEPAAPAPAPQPSPAKPAAAVAVAAPQAPSRPVNVVASQNAAQVRAAQQQQARPAPAPVVRPVEVKAAPAPSASGSGAGAGGGSSTPAKKVANQKGNAFGGPSMSKEFELWCMATLKEITGNDDLTLPQFLMTLKDEKEIRDYALEVLGNTPAVQDFADGFLRHKDFSKEKTVIGVHTARAAPVVKAAVAAAVVKKNTNVPAAVGGTFGALTGASAVAAPAAQQAAKGGKKPANNKKK